MSESKVLFEVHGFEVYSDTTYVVRDKEDLNAPSGFIKAGITKLPSDGVGETFQCAYVKKSATTGVWDTGFRDYSPCYSNISDKKKVERTVETLLKNVVEPYEKHVGEKGELDHKNDEFWSRRSFEVYTGQPFDTSNPEDVLTLYFALMTRQLTPKGKEGDSSYKQSSFIVVDINKDIKRKDEKAADFFEAVGVFQHLQKSDKPRLLSILNYSGLPVAPDIEKKAFQGIFNEYLTQSGNNNSNNTKTFLELVEETESEEGRSKIEIYLNLKDSFKKGGKVSKSSNGVYFYQEDEIGPDLKAAAGNIVKQKELEHIKRDILLIDEEDENED